MGFEIDAGATGVRFLAGSKTYPGLDREGDFFTFDVEVGPGYESCGEGDDGAFLCAEDDCGDDMWSCVECTPECCVLQVASSTMISCGVEPLFTLVMS